MTRTAADNRLRTALRLDDSAAIGADRALAALSSTRNGLSAAEVARRARIEGPNVLAHRRAHPLRVLGRQFASPILLLLLVTAGVSLFLGERTNAAIIAAILVASIGLGFVNEYRAERAADALHDRVRHTVVVVRDGRPQEVDVTALVPGDVVRLAMGAVVPADMRLVDAHDLSCDEGIVTGESLPVAKTAAPIAAGGGIGDLASCLLMGTVVQSGSAVGVVVATGSRTQFGRIESGLATQQPQTEFQRGLGRFSVLLLEVALILTTLIFVANVILQRPVLDALLFSLAIAVGMTPQLLPAVVSASLATGSRALARRNVLVKRLVCIEDLGDMDILVTDKTGTLTDGRIGFREAVPVDGAASAERVLLLGLLATETPEGGTEGETLGLNTLDAALWGAPRPAAVDPGSYRRIDVLPFDHDRRMTTALVSRPDGSRLVVTKGAPEDVFGRCRTVHPEARSALDAAYADGARVVAVAVGQPTRRRDLDPSAENDLVLMGLLLFVDSPKADARASLETLGRLGIAAKIATGDAAPVAEKVLRDVGIESTGTLVGTDIEAMDDDALRVAVAGATIFARVSPEQKARIIRSLRHSGRSVGFLGDGVNDALALHEADIGISVETAADVAKDAADVLLLDKDLGVLADGVMEGRRIFANTIKYVLMGTSSNFGNMFSASLASVVLPFLPMLPGQILLNNLLYDAGQLAIPGDRVDPEQLSAPSHWDIGYIRRFMLLFGPISSLFDIATFGLMLVVFHAGHGEFRAGWFIESIATQTLIIFAVRTRRVPFLRSRPSTGLIVASLSVVAVGVWLPFSPVGDVLGFAALPAPFFLALVGMILGYLVCVDAAKAWFFARPAQRVVSAPPRTRHYPHRVQRRSARFRAPSAASARATRSRRRRPTRSVA